MSRIEHPAVDEDKSYLERGGDSSALKIQQLSLLLP